MSEHTRSSRLERRCTLTLPGDAAFSSALFSERNAAVLRADVGLSSFCASDLVVARSPNESENARCSVPLAAASGEKREPQLDPGERTRVCEELVDPVSGYRARSSSELLMIVGVCSCCGLCEANREPSSGVRMAELDTFDPTSDAPTSSA